MGEGCLLLVNWNDSIYIEEWYSIKRCEGHGRILILTNEKLIFLGKLSYKPWLQCLPTH